MSKKNGKTILGTQLIVKKLAEAGVDYVFGYPGGQVILLYDALYDAPFKHILARHEQGAAHAADGYARATGKLGVVIATSGPGATNIVTGLATANMDSVPMLAITGQVATDAIGNDSFQEADIYGISIPITKYNYLVNQPEQLPNVLDEAIYIATTGRPGPVLIDVPKNTQLANFEIDETKEKKPIKILGYNPKPKGHPGQIDYFIKILSESKKPLAYLGGGANASGAEENLYNFITKAEIPVVNTLMGKGAFPENHALSLGLPGMHGSKYANHAIYESDLIIALGSRFDDRVAGNVKAFAPEAKFVHIDIDPVEIGKRIAAHIPIVGDLNSVLIQVLEKFTYVARPEWLKRIQELKNKYPIEIQESTEVIKAQKVIKTISDLTQGEAIIVTDVGQHQMWAAQHICSIKPRRFLSSGGLGTMGFGLPAAIGAQLGVPDLPVILITGDGSIQMCIQELATVKENNLPIKIVLINNGCLGMVRQWQEFFFNERYSSTIAKYTPDFIKLANAYGINGRRVTKPCEVEEALKEMLNTDGPQFYEFVVAQNENVLPMIPSGGGQIDFFEKVD